MNSSESSNKIEKSSEVFLSSSKTPTTSPSPSPSPNKQHSIAQMIENCDEKQFVNQLESEIESENEIENENQCSSASLSASPGSIDSLSVSTSDLKSNSIVEDDSQSSMMCQLASLTAAATAVESANNVRPNQSQKINGSSSIALPPISRVFPQHFGSYTSPQLSNGNVFKSSDVQSKSHSQYRPQQYNYSQGAQSGQSAQGQGQGYHKTFSSSSSAHSPSYPPAPPLNYYQTALQRIKDTRPAVYNHQSQVPLQGAYPIGYHPNLHHQQPPSLNSLNYSLSSVDRKRSFGPSLDHHQQQQQQPPQSYHKSIKSTIQHPVKNSSTDTTPSNGSSAIQTKMNFRNFGIQLSSKATNLTSNQSGSASSDKEHFAAVMQDCVIATSVDFLNAFPDYRPIVNNKLKPLKFIEFVQEQLFLHYNDPSGFINGIPQKDDLVYFYRAPESLISKKSDVGRFKVFRHSRNIGIAIYRNGARIFPVTPQDISDFWMEVPRNRPVVAKERTLDDIEDGDLIMICRAYHNNLAIEADVLAQRALHIPPGQDLDDLLPAPGSVSDNLRGENGTIMAVLGNEFDEYMLEGAEYRIRHVIHVEKNGHTAIDEPWSYAITKHTLVLRSYLALLYSDASKINRFSPTIEYIIRKVKSAPLGESILKHLGKLSEIQHMAGAMVVGDKLKIWSTGGAFMIHIRKSDPKSSDWSVYFPQITKWSVRDLPVVPLSELSVQDGDFLLLCCPEIRQVWKEDEIVSVIKSRAIWPDKLQILAERLIDDRNSKNGIGLYEVTAGPASSNFSNSLTSLSSN